MINTVMVILLAAAATATFIMACIVLQQRASFEQKTMMVFAVNVFAFNYACLMQTLADTQEVAVAYLYMAVFASAFLPAMCYMFTSRLLNRKMSVAITAILGMKAILLWVFLVLDRHLHILFSSFEFVALDTGGYILNYSKQPYMNFDRVLSFIAILYSMVLIFYEIRKSKDADERRTYKRLLPLIGIFAVFYPVSIIANGYGLSILGIALTVGCGALVYAIRKFNLIDVVVSARDNIVETMSDAMLIIDYRHYLKDMNRAAEELFPELSEHKGNLLPEEYNFLFENIDGPLNYEKNGRHMVRHLSPVYHYERITGYCATLVDVTDMHNMLEEMQSLRNQADAANQSKSRFLASMSHEIRTPMNAIVGYSDLLINEVTTESGRNYARAMRSSSTSLLHIINDILDFSKIEQGKLEIIEDEYRIEQLFNEITDIMSMPAEKKGLRFLASLEQDIPSVLYGDKIRIRQILFNIVSNAIKYTNDGSVKMIAEWERESDDRLELSFIISDTGIGIKKDDMNKLYIDFEQVDTKRNYGVEGTGLGLSITKSLLEMMGGSIHIESEYGVGTTVVIRLKQRIVDEKPINEIRNKQDEKNEKASGLSSPSICAPDAKILVVDDNRVNLQLMQSFLKQFRIVPELAGGGEEAVELARNNHYDIIFMDQMMPGMDGVEAMKAIRALGGERKNMPIIALTANAIAGTRNILLGEGFTDYASKPIAIKTLEFLLEQYLPGGSQTLTAEVELAKTESKAAKRKIKPVLPAYINQEKGITNCGGDAEQYREILGIVFRYADEKLKKVQELLEAENYKNYTVEVHALKSNAATVGADKIAEIARAQEMAGKEGNIDELKKNHDRLVKEYGEFAEALKRYISGMEEYEADKEAASDGEAVMSAEQEEYMQTFAEIRSSICEERYSDARDLFGILEFFELPPREKTVFTNMKRMLDDSDWTGIVMLLDDFAEDKTEE